MAERATKTALEGAVKRYVRALELAGLGRFSNVKLECGSVRNGQAWRLYGQGATRFAPGVGPGASIGNTSRQALDTLDNLARAFEDAYYFTQVEK